MSDDYFHAFNSMQQPALSYLRRSPNRSISKTYISQFLIQIGRRFFTQNRRSLTSRPMSTLNEGIRLAVLHQVIEPPLINGIRKPMKPGGKSHHSLRLVSRFKNPCFRAVMRRWKWKESLFLHCSSRCAERC